MAQNRCGSCLRQSHQWLVHKVRRAYQLSLQYRDDCLGSSNLSPGTQQMLLWPIVPAYQQHKCANASAGMPAANIVLTAGQTEIPMTASLLSLGSCEGVQLLLCGMASLQGCFSLQKLPDMCFLLESQNLLNALQVYIDKTRTI